LSSLVDNWVVNKEVNVYLYTRVFSLLGFRGYHWYQTVSWALVPRDIPAPNSQF